MGERTEHAPGTFSWTDLGTTDTEGAKRFYTQLFGWDAEDMPAGDGAVYTMFVKDGKTVAACYEQYAEQREQGVPPNWLSYVTVTSADDSAKRASSLGGSVLQQPFDVLDVGRMALVADPQGAVLALWQPRSHIGAQLVNEPGALCWNDLRTTDTVGAVSFYTQLFGWGAEEIDIGPAGTYTTLRVGESANGGIMRLPEAMTGVPPHWGVYFAVEDCDKGVALVEQLGGSLMVPPIEVPAGRFALVADPQGAPFSLFSGRLDP